MRKLTLLTVLMWGIGCDGTEPEPDPPEPLSLAEVQALYDGIEALVADTMPEIISVDPSTQSAVVACPLGGQTGLSFVAEEEQTGNSGRLTTTVTLTPDECVIGNLLLTGSPSLIHHVVIDLEIDPDDLSLTFTVSGSTNGTLEWVEQGDPDRFGTCEIMLTITTDEPDPNSPGLTTITAGMMCGHEVSFETVADPVISQPGG